MLSAWLLVNVTIDDGVSTTPEEVRRAVLLVLWDAFNAGAFTQFVPQLASVRYLGPDPGTVVTSTSARIAKTVGGAGHHGL